MSSDISGSFIGALLLDDGPLLAAGAAVRVDGAELDGIEDCAAAMPVPSASKATTDAAVANFGTTRVMFKPR
jgi:hypothetical protein